MKNEELELSPELSQLFPTSITETPSDVDMVAYLVDKVSHGCTAQKHVMVWYSHEDILIRLYGNLLMIGHALEGASMLHIRAHRIWP